MFCPRKKIKVSIKLYGNIDKDAGIKSYDSASGIVMTVRERTTLGRALRQAGLHKAANVVVFLNGKPASPKDPLKQGDVILCMRPLAGG